MFFRPKIIIIEIRSSLCLSSSFVNHFKAFAYHCYPDKRDTSAMCSINLAFHWLITRRYFPRKCVHSNRQIISLPHPLKRMHANCICWAWARVVLAHVASRWWRIRRPSPHYWWKLGVDWIWNKPFDLCSRQPVGNGLYLHQLFMPTKV